MNIFGLAKSFINPANFAMLAMGPAGWASIATKMVMSAVGQQIIQQIGQKLGLPQSVIGMAQNVFATASGTQGMPTSIRDAVSQLAEHFNLSPRQQGQLERAAENDVNKAIEKWVSESAESKESKEAKAGGGKGWLMAIAQSLGNSANKMAKDLKAQGDALGKDATAKQNIEFQAKAQEFSQFFSGANTVIKTLGEALSAGARKQ